MIVLGFHGGVTIGQHEPGAALVVNGRVLAVCEEERYLRNKSSYGHLPYYSIKACLEIGGISFDDIDLVVATGITYDDHVDRISDYLRHTFGHCPKVELIHHQHAHLATSFYGSGFDSSLCLSLDATGDGSCGMLAHATKKDGIKILETIPTSNSLGYFYTLMTYYLGFSDGDEYKVMGLAPYGEPSYDLSKIVRPVDGGWEFQNTFVRSEPVVRSPFEPLYSEKVAELLGQPSRIPGSEMTEFHRNIARSTQAIMETCLLSVAKELKRRVPDESNLCYAGGIALNCSANRSLQNSGMFENIHVSPLSSDRGLALGCAYMGAVSLGDTPWPLLDAYLGSSYSNDVIRAELEANSVPFEEVDDPCAVAAGLLNEDKILGWYQGRSEAGARALGNRSIIAACGDATMRDKVNARIKYREEFRPFAPSALHGQADEYFRTDGVDYPYMCFTVDVHPEKADSIRAVAHVDNSARLQTVRSSNNEMYFDLIQKYQKLSDMPVILNTSFNLKGQPIVETPRDALMTFYGCGLDALVLGNFIVRKDRA